MWLSGLGVCSGGGGGGGGGDDELLRPRLVYKDMFKCVHACFSLFLLWSCHSATGKPSND